MNKEDYVSKMRDHLYNSGSYKKIKENPISKITKMVKKAIKDSSIDERMKKILSPINEIIPRIYGGPKIHKADACWAANMSLLLSLFNTYFIHFYPSLSRHLS